MIITERQANYSVNITLHVLILFTFLSVFFFAYISKLTEKSVSDSLNSMIKEETENMLDYINGWDQQLNPENPTINWEGVNDLAQEIQDSSEGTPKEIEDNNERLKKLSFYMILGLVVLLIGMIVFYQVRLGYKIEMKEILIENIVIFSFIGLIEYLFFTQIAVKYVPVTPDVASTTILQRINDNILDEVKLD